MSISTTIKSIQNTMRKDAGVNGDAQRIEQLVWMFFLKILDAQEEEQELMEESFRSPLPEELRWRNWAADDEGITGEALLDFVNNKLFPTLKDLPITAPHSMAGVVRSVFEDAHNFMKNGTLLRQVVNALNEIDFNSSQDRHLFGDIYETILKDLQSAGHAGEFYTPRGVTQFIVDMVDIKLGETVFDPACGTGGFLTSTIDTVRAKQVHSATDEETLQKSIRGIEKKPLPHLLAVTNMLLHGIQVPSNIRHDNTLARPTRDYGPQDRVDVIVTNPPFGGKEEDGIDSNFPAAFRTSETADLFLYLIVHLLKPGGRAGVVLPDGTLFGDGVTARIKERLMDQCNLHTIVKLPKGVFAPYTSIKTNILFFTKGVPTTDIWYFEHPYPDGYKSYSKTKPIRIEEFDLEKSWWNDREESELAWKVTAKSVKDNGYNLDIDNPNRVEDGHRSPDVLLAEYQKAEKLVDELREQLRTALAGSLE